MMNLQLSEELHISATFNEPALMIIVTVVTVGVLQLLCTLGVTRQKRNSKYWPTRTYLAHKREFCKDTKFGLNSYRKLQHLH